MDRWSLKLTPECRAELLNIFPPKYPLVAADHITMGTGSSREIPGEMLVIGVADDGKGIQALVLEVNGHRYRPDQNPYHITWSYDPDKIAPAWMDLKLPPKQKAMGYRPMHSNKLIAGDHFVSSWLLTPIKIEVMSIMGKKWVEESPGWYTLKRGIVPS